MSKAILIVDMPSKCGNCPCLDCGDDRCCCNALNKDIEDILIIDKDCPLKPLPEKKEIQYPTTDGITTLIDCEYMLNDYLFDKGYNNCIDEILGVDTTRDCKTCGHSNNGKCAGTEECHACMWVNNYIEADI